jgi:hypothetical protein
MPSIMEVFSLNSLLELDLSILFFTNMNVLLLLIF